jgi:hypothetical protein
MRNIPNTESVTGMCATWGTPSPLDNAYTEYKRAGDAENERRTLVSLSSFRLYYTIYYAE